jgi:hypothetical protein
MRPIFPWFDHSLDPSLDARLTVGSVPDHVPTMNPPSAQSPFAPCGCDPHGGDVASASSENITPPSSLLRTHSPVAVASPLLRFYPRWRSLCRLSPVPAARRTFPTLSPRTFPWMLDPIPRRSHSVLLPVSSAVSSAFPTRSWVGFPRIVRLKRLHAGRRFRGGRYFFMFRPPVLRRPPGRPYRCKYFRRAAGACTSGQNVFRYLRTHRIC